MNDTAEKRKVALQMARQGIPVTEIVRVVRSNRSTVMRWLGDAGVEPTMLRSKPKSNSRSLANTPLALSIEDSVRKRLRKREEEEAREAAG